MITQTLKPMDLMIKARVKLQKENPFFSYLVMNLNLKIDNEINTACVDNKGNLFFNEKFIEGLDFEEVKTLLSHEVLHIALNHINRLGKKQHELWNISTDVVINNLLSNNDFRFGNGLSSGLVPNTSNSNEIEIKTLGIIIKEIDKKSADEVYTELKPHLQKLKEKYKELVISEPKFSDKEQDEESKKEENEWKKKMVEANTFAKMKGSEPKGLEKYIGELYDSKINWKALLYRYITSEIPIDYTYNYPNKRSASVGVFLPSIKREVIDISIAVDTSGSIGKKELTEFLSEIVYISKSFNSIRVNICFWDTEIKNHYVVENGNIDEIMKYDLFGGGGTDFTSVYAYLKDNIPNTRLLLFFTDGYANFPSSEEIKTIWVLCSGSCEDSQIPFGEIIRIENEVAN